MVADRIATIKASSRAQVAQLSRRLVDAKTNLTVSVGPSQDALPHELVNGCRKVFGGPEVF